MARLSVNLNKIALLRNSRHTGVPDLLSFARIAVESGAAGITVHPRPDERHIKGTDIPAIAEFLKPWRPRIELNIEGYPDERFLKMVEVIRPEQCTLVPDTTTAFTSDKGWDFTHEQLTILEPAIAAFKKMGTRVIVFVDPNPHIVTLAKDAGTNGIEIYTGSYAAAFRAGSHQELLTACADTAARARYFGLVVNIGHDLNLHNLPPLLALAPHVAEASIGHELTADALRLGFGATVRAYATVLASLGDAPKEKRTEKNPFTLFKHWYESATLPHLAESHAVTLATASRDKKPSARTVLLKSFDAKGFVFYTNYESKKGRDLATNPNAALLFYWPHRSQQVRITGKVKRVSRSQSERYFHSRPRESQLGAWASAQSSVIESRDSLETRLEELRTTYADKTIPLPPHWGGYVLVPEQFEFWSGGSARLHDRLLYTRTKRGWTTSRLAP